MFSLSFAGRVACAELPCQVPVFPNVLLFLNRLLAAAKLKQRQLTNSGGASFSLGMENFSERLADGRVDRRSALEFLKEPSPISLGERAYKTRCALHGNKAYYAVNAAITYSNVCEALCPICSFSRREGADGAYVLSAEDAYERAKKFSAAGAEEVHIIGGIYSKLPLEYYLDFVRAVKRADSRLNVVAFTVSECALMSRVSGKPLEQIFDLLLEAGVNALPGGGAEIFEESIRRQISPNKLTAQEWLEAMRAAHKRGLRTNATMLYGHIETPESVVEHLFRLRELQDETGGFKAFVPLPFRRGKSAVPSKGSGVYDLKIVALARVVLDNFAHVRIPITHFGDRLAQVLLNFGADDIGGTHWVEEVASSAGAERIDRTEAFMRGVIQDAGFEPVKGNSNYV